MNRHRGDDQGRLNEQKLFVENRPWLSSFIVIRLHLCAGSSSSRICSSGYSHDADVVGPLEQCSAKGGVEVAA